MPEFAVEITDPNGVLPAETLLVKLSKVPKQGSSFDLGGGVPAQVKQVRMIGGEPVIFAQRDKLPGRPRLKPQRRSKEFGG